MEAPQQTCPDQQPAVSSPEDSASLANSRDDATPADGDPGLAPLTPEEVSEVQCNARSIGDRITQRQHSDFIELVFEEAQGQVQSDPRAAPEP